MAAPLDGIRVLEVANWLAAPATAALMADMGADVIKVEPPGGDAYRGTTVRLGFDAPMAANFAFELDNRGKRSISVALDKPGGPELVRRLAASCDVFVTNLLPERKVRYGLNFDEVKAASPRIVYASLSGYGTIGPDAWRPGFDHAAFWASSGVMGLLGEPDDPAVDCRSGQGDHTTSLNLLAAVLAGLRLRDITGEAQHVETSLQASGMWTIGSDYASSLGAGSNPRKVSRLAPRHPIANCYQCANGEWIQFAMPRPFPGYWPRFCEAMEKPEWAAPPPDGAQDLGQLRERTEEWVLALDGMFPTRSRAEWGARFDQAGIIWAPVATLMEVAESEQVKEMGWIAEVTHPDHGPYRTLNTPFRIHGSETGARGAAPRAGEHTSDVLAGMGIDAEQIAALAATGVFG